MSQPFIGEVQMFAGNFAPRGWAFCQGQLLSIAQNTALFSLLGTTYGGDGSTTFGLPNLAGRVPVGPGNGPGLSTWRQGEVRGTETVTLTTAQMPNHAHVMRGSGGAATEGSPANHALAEGDEDNYAASATTTDMTATSEVGGGQPHNNLQPYLTVQFIIALEGVYPSRS